MKVKTITKKWLQMQNASTYDIKLWETVKISDPMVGLRWLMRKKLYPRANCLIVQMMNKKQYCQYADYAAKQAIKLVRRIYHEPSWEMWARKWLTGEDRSAGAAAEAAGAAAEAAGAAVQLKILRHGMQILRENK